MEEIHTFAQLRVALGGPPGGSAINAIRKRLEPIDEEWLRRSSFYFMATCGVEGADCSPRGDPPGFIAILDNRTIALPEKTGNRRGDGYHNLIENPLIGLCFLIPPATVMLRINGRARMVRDVPYFTYQPVFAIVVKIDEIFYHCSRAVERSGFFDPGAWRDDVPSRAEITRALRGEQ